MHWNNFRMIIASILLAWISSYIIYFGFTTNYTRRVFCPAGFEAQYTHDVYKYRILSQILLIRLDSALSGDIESHTAEERLMVQDKAASERFYFAYYYLNTFWVLLTAILLVLIVNLRKLRIASTEKMPLVFLCILFINITQFVICPYDTCGYFFELLIIYLYLRFFEQFYLSTLVAICILMVVSTLNRESSAMTLVFLILMFLSRYGFSSWTVSHIFLLSFFFLATYAALRYFIRTSDPPIDNSRLLKSNFLLPRSRLGIYFWLVSYFLTWSISISRENKILIAAFHIFCIPYIWTCLSAGGMWELRLYLPLFLGSLVVAKMDLSGHVFRVTNLLKSRDSG